MISASPPVEPISTRAASLSLLGQRVTVISVQLGFVVNRPEVGEAGVQPGAVIERFDVVEDSGANLDAGGKSAMLE